MQTTTWRKVRKTKIDSGPDTVSFFIFYLYSTMLPLIQFWHIRNGAMLTSTIVLCCEGLEAIHCCSIHSVGVQVAPVICCLSPSGLRKSSVDLCCTLAQGMSKCCFGCGHGYHWSVPQSESLIPATRFVLCQNPITNLQWRKSELVKYLCGSARGSGSPLCIIHQ